MLSFTCAALTFAPSAFRAPAQSSRAASVVMATPNAAPIYDGEYAAELRQTAAAMVAPGKGLLACGARDAHGGAR